MPVQQQWIQQAYVFALDATPRQERRFWSHAGAARFCYNWGLDTFAAHLDRYAADKAAGVEKPDPLPGHFALCKLWKIHKDAHAETPDERGRTLGWVGEQFSGTYQAALRDAHMAWSNFFKSRSGQRAGRRMGRPKFKSRHKAKAAFQMHGEGLQITDAHHVKLPKIGLVKTHESTRKLLRRLNKITVCTECTGTGLIPDPKSEDGSNKITCKMCKGNQKLPVARIVRGTISRTSRGRWQIAITAEILREIRTGPSARQRTGGTIGIDLGVRDIITTSSGTVYPAPQHLEHAQTKLRKLGRALSRCAKDSKRRTKARARLARAHGRVADLRADNLKKVTTALIHTHEHLVVEGWNAQALAERGSAALPKHVRKRRNRHLADASPGNTRWYLSSKAAWYGATVTIAETHEATSRTCSGCGQVRTKPVPQDQEQFTCAGCGLTLSRRLNTARLLAKGRAKQVAPSGGETLNARGGDVRPETPRRSGQSPMKREARRQPKTGSNTGTPDP